jgi:hypothetical protein
MQTHLGETSDAHWKLLVVHNKSFLHNGLYFASNQNPSKLRDKLRRRRTEETYFTATKQNNLLTLHPALSGWIAQNHIQIKPYIQHMLHQ